MTLTWPPVSFSQSGARRWSGSATCGPLKVRMLTLRPANFVPGEAATAEADAAGADAALDAAGADPAGDEGDGLAVLLQPVMARIGMIAAATSRYRDTAGSPPLDIRRRLSSILNRWRYAGQYAATFDKVKIQDAVQPADRCRPLCRRR